ncbi:sigma 54-interacting transcriptional regulator [Muricauda oceani]|uniref:Sigma 54-interacting transcriptional regulator n=1 Tax=Flagellimonas oceani TaxID=2698672 RepID=A0A6G7IZY7_9FLAO|nr:sigma 54-interacting response regulator [Allomuricauda oceani]MBW8244804.1 sigma 54-interacting transcriptional regulator [Allomuricauda oceani]QII43884.1 sigma 54-interacting transcriptional regulator [Allomuricauda oceani]
MKKQILIVEDEFIVANDLSNILRNAGYEVAGIVDSYGLAMKKISASKPYLALLDIRLKGELTGIDLAKQLIKQNIPFIFISANSNRAILEEVKPTKPYGFLVKPFRAKDVLVALEIAFYHHEHSKNMGKILEQNLVDGINTLQQGFDATKGICTEFTQVFRPYISFDYLELTPNPTYFGQHPFGCFRLGLNEYQSIGFDQLSSITSMRKEVLNEKFLQSTYEKVPTILDTEELTASFGQNPFKELIVNAFKLKSQMSIPIPFSGELLHLNFFHKQNNIYSNNDIEVLVKLTPQIGEVLAKCLGAKQIENQSAKVTKPSPGKTLDSPKSFEGIVGNSPQLLTVFDLIRKVAPMETSVLILGESGTGKELIARAIHSLSQRKDYPLVTINCGALPENLIESILFGHEKGAFTGALDTKIGKFEQANGGTIFLDEIGEMPLNLQVRLLRVLQEKAIEKVGATKPQKLDIRIIAATNKNLDKEVEEGRFRLDLYYRLNVFPILLAPLRERKQDIPLLARHFVDKFCTSQGKEPMEIDEYGLKSLLEYDWPGNIRELENCIEKSILLADGDTIGDVHLPFNKSGQQSKSWDLERVRSISELERDYIIHILRKCKGKVFGKNGAAELLKIPTSTLNSKMRKLGIDKKEINM